MTTDPSSRFATDEYAALFDRVAVVREYREAFMENVEGGGVELQALFDRADADPVIGSTKVLGLVEGMPAFGKVQTRRAFEDLGISEASHVGAVTNEQRQGLPEALGRHER